MDNKKDNGLNINLRQDVAQGAYSNLALITHSSNEFIFDFASMLPGFPKPEVLSRVIMNPENAKKLLIALQDNIGKYEAQFGQIKINNTVPMPMGGFGNNGGAQS